MNVYARKIQNLKNKKNHVFFFYLSIDHQFQYYFVILLFTYITILLNLRIYCQLNNLQYR